MTSFYDLSDRQQSRIKSRLSKFQSDSFVNCWEWLGAKQTAGYGRLNVRVFGKQKILLVHRVSFEIMMNRAIPQGFHVLHKCDNPACFNPKHLFLGTNAMNIADKVEKGRQAKGERNGGAKFTECQVIEIKNKLKRPGLISVQAIANLYGVTTQAIYYIKNGHRWKHLENNNHNDLIAD